MLITINLIVLLIFILFLTIFFIFNHYYTIEVKFKNSNKLNTKNKDLNSLFRIKE
jgi:hypothetical protein